MAQKLIRIDLPKYNCRGLYFEDSAGLFGVKVINDDKLANKVKPPFKVILRTTVTKGATKITSKKTFVFAALNKTLKQAINDINEQRNEFRNHIVNPERKSSPTIQVYTLQEYWHNVYVPYKRTTLSVKEQWKDSTAKDMESFFNAWIKDTSLSKKIIETITREDIEQLIKKIQSKRSLRTSKKTIDCLAPLFKKYYYEHQIMRLNPADIKIGDLDNKREVNVTLEMAKRLYDEMEHYQITQYRNIFLWLRTGRRLNEVLSLAVEDIEVDKRLFHIVPNKNKSGKRTTFILRDELLPSLEEKVFLVHPSAKGTLMNSKTVRDHWKKILEKANITDNIHLHDLRHIIGTVLRDSGVNEELRALVLGHTRSSITARYASQNAKLADDIFEFFLAKIRGKIGSKTQWSTYLED